MTKSSLNPSQRRTVEIIEALGFGAIEHLSIRGGLPCYEPEPGIVQAIKLGSEPERPPDRGGADLTPAVALVISVTFLAVAFAGLGAAYFSSGPCPNRVRDSPVLRNRRTI